MPKGTNDITNTLIGIKLVIEKTKENKIINFIKCLTILPLRLISYFQHAINHTLKCKADNINKGPRPYLLLNIKIYTRIDNIRNLHCYIFLLQHLV